MKKYIALILMLVLCVSCMASCGNKKDGANDATDEVTVNPVDVDTTKPYARAATREKVYKADNGTEIMRVSVSYPEIVVPEGYDATEANKILADYVDAFVAEADDAEGFARDEYASTEFDFDPFLYASGYDVALNKNGVMSIKFTTQVSRGGVHSKYSVSAFTFDLKTDSRIVLTDLLSTNESDIRAFVGDRFKALMSENPSDYYTDISSEEAGEIFELDNFYVSEAGVTFFFEAYEIAPFSTGIPSFTASFSDLTERFPEAYVPEDA